MKSKKEKETIDFYSIPQFVEHLIERLDTRLHEDTILGKEKLIGSILSLKRGKNLTKKDLFGLIRLYSK